MNTENYLHNLDFLRIIFTTFVVLHHTFEPFSIVNLANASVEFFFILSGFFLVYTIEHQKSCENFIVKKIIRFWPLICFSSCCMALLSGDFTYEKIFAPLFFLPATGMFGNFTGSGAIWYICVLLWVSIFYFYFIKNFNKKTVTICIGILTFYNYIICIKYGWGLWHTAGNLKILTTGMSRSIAGMGCGYFIAILHKKHLALFSTSKKPLLKYSIFEVLILIYIMISMFSFEQPTNRIFLVISFIFLIYLFLIKKGIVSQYFEKNSCKDISQYCLPVFLTHNIVITFFQNYVNCLENSTCEICLIFFVSILLGICAHHVIEKPSLKYLQSKLSFEK